MRTILLVFSLIALAAPSYAAQRSSLEKECRALVGKEEPEYGAAVAGAPSDVHEPAEQAALLSEQAKNSTFATPLPASPAFAVSVFGSGEAALTYWPALGAVKETVGARLSTVTFAIVAEIVALPARSVAIARKS